MAYIMQVRNLNLKKYLDESPWPCSGRLSEFQRLSRFSRPRELGSGSDRRKASWPVYAFAQTAEKK